MTWRCRQFSQRRKAIKLSISGIAAHCFWRNHSMILVCCVEIRRWESTKRLVPHCGPGETDTDMVTSPLNGTTTKCGYDTCRAKVAGNVIIEHQCWGEKGGSTADFVHCAWIIGGDIRFSMSPFGHGITRNSEGFHIKPPTVLPWTIPTVATDSEINDSRSLFCNFSHAEAKSLNTSATKTLNKNISVGKKCFESCSLCSLFQVQEC